MTMYTGIYFFP